MSTDDSDRLPYATAKSLRVLGKIRQLPQDFQVRELPAYAPAGEGEHVLLWIEKTDMNTPQAVRAIARALGANPADAGWAGLKDRHAVTLQWISLHKVDPAQALRLELPGVRVIEAAPHPHKIRTGHLRGNRFLIRVRGDRGQLAEAQAIADALAEHGAPNYYGEQRFGRAASNVARAEAWLLGGGRAPRDRFERKLLASALQSAWFNRWLADRVRRGALGQPVAGDLMRKEDTGGLFVTEDSGEAEARMARWEISPTGPIFGHAMRWPEAEALRIERALWTELGLNEEILGRARKLMTGTRRSARVRPEGMEVRSFDDGIELEFSLPKGAYATVILRELLKQEVPEPEAAEHASI